MSLELNLQQVNRFSLKAHFLTNHAQQANLLQAIGDVCGLNAQTARGPYLSLRARIQGFQRGQLTRALFEDKTLIKTWLMRGTVHIVPARDFVIYQRALGGHLVDGWVGQLRRQGFLLPDGARRRLHRKIIDTLAQSPCTKRELLPEIRHLLKGQAEQEQKRHLSWTMRELSYRGLVCHAEPTGPWYHFKEHRFAAVKHWLPGTDLPELAEREARSRLLLKYLHGYGPASLQDFAYWAGFEISGSRTIFEGVKTKLAEVKIRDGKGSFWMLKEDVDRLDDIDLRQKPPIRFLPEFDPLIMGHKDKSRIMDEQHRKRVFLRLADVAPVILLDGRIAGTWSFKVSRGELDISLFEDRGSGRADALKAESNRLRDFLLSR